MEHDVKKKNVPAAGTYDKIETDVDKAKLKSGLGRSEKSNFLDVSMRNSLEVPGIGEYNKLHDEDKRAAKWMQEKGKKAKSVKLPEVGTYQPLPVSYSLF